MQAIQFTQLLKFKGGALSGCFATVDGNPIQVTLKNVTSPLGVSTFGDKQSIILNVDEDVHDVSPLLDVSAAAKEHPDLSGRDFNPIVKCSEKYGRQVKCNITKDTLFFNSKSEPCDSKLFSSRCLVNILVEVNMVWVRGRQCGVSCKVVQLKHLKDITGSNNACGDECAI